MSSSKQATKGEINNYATSNKSPSAQKGKQQNEETIYGMGENTSTIFCYGINIQKNIRNSMVK
jgi:hypothetical protein